MNPSDLPRSPPVRGAPHPVMRRGRLVFFLRRHRAELALGALGAALLLILPWDKATLTGLPPLARAAVGFGMGCCLVLMVRWVRDTAEPLGVEKLALKLPLFGEVSVAISAPQREQAWRLFVELSTRVATQSIGSASDAGHLGSAIRSLYDGFQKCRDEDGSGDE
jgi:hypothetical protein